MQSFNLTIARRSGKTADDGILPLINIVFLMLVFFMVAGTVSSQDDPEVVLPSGNFEAAVPEAMAISVARDGAIRIEGVLLRELSVAALLAVGVHPTTEVGLSVDRELPAAQLDSLLHALRKAGVEQISLFTVVGDVQ